jgi:hypothetical protein
MPRDIPSDPPTFVISSDTRDLGVPGVAVEMDAEEAQAWGAFEETALSEEAALDANLDGDLAHGD